jgi:predicted extracellular nuclease
LTSQPLSVLSEAGFVDLLPKVQKNDRYTYIYNGVSQVLDHVFVRAQRISPVFVFLDHINSDYPHELMSEVDSPHRSSDHDPVRVIFHVSDQFIYFPLITH